MNTYPDMKITKRIVRENKVIGFVIMDTSGIPKELSINQAIKLASNNKFINAKVIIKEGKKHLTGDNGENLNKLPIQNKEKEGKGVA